MSDTDRRTLDAYVEAALRLQNLTIDPSWRDGIFAHFQVIEAASRRIVAVPLDDEVEAAPVFTP